MHKCLVILWENLLCYVIYFEGGGNVDLMFYYLFSEFICAVFSLINIIVNVLCYP